MYQRSWTLGSLSRQSAVAVVAALVLLLGLSLPPAPAIAATSHPTVYWGAKTGPINIPAKKWRLVAALPLPKGRYFVSATATLVGKGGSPNQGNRVYCQLLLGSAIDTIEATPSRADYGGSRVSVLLTVAGRLRSPGRARLRCYGVSELGDVSIRDIRISAIRAGRLTLQDGMELVAKRTTFGSGKPRIISARSDLAGTGVNGNGVYQTVGVLDLPPGRWWVIAKGIANPSGLGSGESPGFRCRLVAGVDHDDLMFGLGRRSQASSKRAMPLGLQVVHRFRSSGAAVLECKGPFEFAIYDAVITAVKAGRLTNIPLEAAVGWSAGTGSPRIISGWANGPVNIPIRSTYKTIRKLDLPKGRWTVLAKLSFDARGSILIAPAANHVARTDCRLKFGSRKSPSQVRYIADYSRTAPMVMSIDYHATTRQPVKLQCRGTAAGDAYFIKITALKAGSLVKRPL